MDKAQAESLDEVPFMTNLTCPTNFPRLFMHHMTASCFMLHAYIFVHYASHFSLCTSCYVLCAISVLWAMCFVFCAMCCVLCAISSCFLLHASVSCLLFHATCFINAPYALYFIHQAAISGQAPKWAKMSIQAPLAW